MKRILSMFQTLVNNLTESMLNKYKIIIYPLTVQTKVYLYKTA